MLTALAVVRMRLSRSPTSTSHRSPASEFLLGKQLPYVGLAMVNFLLMALLAVTVFDVPVKGSFVTLALAALVFGFAPPAWAAGLHGDQEPDRGDVSGHDPPWRPSFRPPSSPG